MDTKNKIEILQAEAAIQKLVEEISRYSSHSREADAAVKSIKDAIKELTINRESLDGFFQRIQDQLQQNAATSVSEIKEAVERLVRCIEQESKENERFQQTNDQLQTLAGRFEGITQNINDAIERIRQSLVEKLQSLEQTLTPFKNTVVRQEITLGQFSSDFARLTADLGDVQQNLHTAAQGTEHILSELKTGVSAINQRFDRIQDAANAATEVVEQSSNDMMSMLSRIEQILSDHFGDAHQEQQNYGVAVDDFRDAQSKTMKFLKWNAALAFLNLAMLVGGLAYFFLVILKP